ncbi:substrate-binding domain-containing protein [Desulfosporosinus sp. BICA1-9]|uniref:sugar ABC transporter substrate-binding protein n=1 Tax=Desulfosporosinus sp. BICA1-9 TaxID=1531958 RepID=UPI00054B9873|nr:substrate-binding domain-containing protein [Desulfosporosinus sp. BICA1-9]KJS50378.1 MAG: sugar ABC transporter substrate-binding protein [Peptococcaceae bacterium BRH_c23]KJS89568.1 MAG: sugar ABC transporter substrate-binding protein [Desulfosporosinus sp. BICA1-9]HBW36640.1 sugar ABC transporter substrate-binding protein [Desulfosporosinus sp.]
MSRRFKFLLIMISLCLSLTITGCGLQDLLGKNKSKTATKKAENQTIIAVSLNEDDPNKLLISKGIEDFAKKENAKVIYMEKKSGADPLKGAKILIYQGGDSSILQKSQKEEIPILALTQLPSGVKPEGIITPDQEKAGALMAQTLVSKVSEGLVVILQGDPNESGSQERLAGNKAVLSKYPKIAVHTIASTPGSESLTRTGLVEFLQKNPETVQGILAHTEKLALQASEVLKQLDKKISLVGGQVSLASIERMSSGTQMGDIDTSPYLQGVNAYQWAQKIIKKQPLEVNDSITSEQGEIPAKIIAVKAVTPENISIIQNSYTKTIKSAEQDKKAKEQEDKKEKSSGQASEGKDKEEAGKEGEAKNEGKSEEKGSSAIPAEAKKVTERIKTETNREYLDAQGKVIGTEKTVNEQVKTVPSEMIKQQAEQSQVKAKDGGDEAKDKEGDKKE